MKQYMKRLQLLAVFMSLLIISTPFVFAQQLTVTRYSGSHGTNGFVNSIDTLNVTVTVEVPGSPDILSVQQRVRLFHDDDTTWEPFDACSILSPGIYECTLIDTRVLGDITTSKMFSIRLLDATRTSIIASEEITLTLDRESPRIKLFTIDPPATKGRTTRFDYEVEDYAHSVGDTTSCSGIREITFMVDGDIIATRAGALESCGERDSFEYQFSDVSKEYSVCARSEDFMGRTSDFECRDFRVDRNPPSFDELKILSEQGFEFTHVKPGASTIATIEATITGEQDDVDTRTVSADFSLLNPSMSTPQSITSRDNTMYRWNRVSITSPQTCEVVIEARDTLGNRGSKTFTCSLPLDSTGPIVESITTGVETVEGTPILPEFGNITVDLKDLDNTGNPGIGFQQGNVFLDGRELGLSRSIPPTICVERNTPGGWSCTFTIIPTVRSGTYTIKVNTAETRDDLDNVVTETGTTTIIFDKDSPEIVGVDRTRITHSGVVTAFGVQGDIVELWVRAKDFDNVFADFSGIGLGDTPPIECVIEGEEQVCHFSAVITTSGPSVEELVVYFSDFAGNVAAIEQEIEILSIADDPNPNHWSIQEHQVVCSPKVVDRGVTDIINFPVYCTIPLRGLGAGGERELPGLRTVRVSRNSRGESAGLQVGDIILDYEGVILERASQFTNLMSGTNPSSTVTLKVLRGDEEQEIIAEGGHLGILAQKNRERILPPQLVTANIQDFTQDCAGDLSGFVDSIGVINNGLGSTAPILSVRLATSDFLVNNITFSCDLELFSRIDDRLTQNPEKETVDVTIRFANSPLGEAAQKLDESIQEAVDDAQSYLPWISDLRKIQEMAEVICQGWNALVTIVTTLATFLMALGALSSIVGTVYPAAEAPILAAEVNVCHAEEQIRKVVSDNVFGKIADKMCGFIDCRENLLETLGSFGKEGPLLKDESGKTVTDSIGNPVRQRNDWEQAGYDVRSKTTEWGNAWVGAGGIVGGDGSSFTTGNNQLALGKEPSSYLNVKDSLVYSIWFPPLCIPGIIHNMNKLREIKCEYALCMSREVRSGMPSYVCREAKSYQECRFVTGEIFHLVPILPIIQSYINEFIKLIQDPIVLAVTLIAYGIDCEAACSGTGKAATNVGFYSACAFIHITNLIGKSIATISAIEQNKNLGKESTASCDALEEHLEGLEGNV